MADTKTKDDKQYVAGSDEWWRVEGPYVTVKTATTEGMRIIGLHRGGVLPLDVSQEQITHLASHGLIEKFTMDRGQRQQLRDDPPGGHPGPRAVEADEAAPGDAGEAGGQRPTQAPASGSTPHQRAAGGTSGRAASSGSKADSK